MGQFYVDPKRATAKSKEVGIKDPAAIEKAFRKRFADIDFDVNIYITNTVISGFDYDVINSKRRLQLLQNRLGFEIKIPSENEATFILFPGPPTPDDPAHPSAWGITHDLVHTMTLSSRYANKLLDAVENKLSLLQDRAHGDIAYMIDKRPPNEPELWKDLAIVRNWGAFLNAIGTMGSARAGYFSKRPEEFTTEFMTQWMFSGKVEFTTEWAHTEEVAELLIDDLSKIANYADQVFWKILDNARGKIFVGQG